jgi:O-antigen/teichoic acid export membrane protein
MTFESIYNDYNRKLLSLKQNKGLLLNIKNTGLYFGGSILQSVLALIAQPIYSIHLSADEFGIIGYFLAIQGFFTPIFIFGMTSVYLMRYFKQSEEDNKKLLFNLTFFLCCFNTIILFISYCAVYIYFKIMSIDLPLYPYTWLILISLFLNNIKAIVLINFRIRKKALSFFALSATNSILNVGLGLLFVVYFKWGAPGRMFAPVVTATALLPLCIYVLRKYTTINFNIKVYLKATKVAFPLVLAAYAYVPIVNIDRIFLERLNNIAELGLYSIGITIAGYTQLAYIALGTAFEPDIYESVAKKDNKKLFKIAIIMFVPFLLFIIIFMAFSETIVSLLTAGRYIAAVPYTNIALISVFLMGIFSFFAKIFIALGKPKLNLIVNTIGGVSAFIIMYVAVSKYNYIGAAYGKIIIALIMVVISSYYAIKHLRKQMI